mgnify:CR=1 FL=1
MGWCGSLNALFVDNNLAVFHSLSSHHVIVFNCDSVTAMQFSLESFDFMTDVSARPGSRSGARSDGCDDELIGVVVMMMVVRR